jgi:predicted ATPase/class 3 adenylate cyclase
MERAPLVELPTGEVTLLFSDIEGSTRLLHRLGDAYGDLLATHHEVLRSVWDELGGVEVNTEGDAFFVAFSEAAAAVEAAAAAQRALARQDWPEADPVRVRMGVHTGSPRVRGDDYWGIDVHYAARLCSAANGGQVLVSESTAALVDSRLEDLGEHALKDFPSPRHVYHLVVGGLGSDRFAPVRTLRAGRTNLPDQLSSFLGREQELTEVCTLLDNHRLVTLAGTGGVGKTRLALAAAARLLDGSGDGVWLVELAPSRDPHLVATSVATVLSVEQDPGVSTSDAIVDAVASRSLLLVLDNCEHLIEAVAELVAQVVPRCPGLVVLATSRESLGVEGEHVYRVPSLVEAEAVHLFAERAAAQRPGFVVDDTNEADVAAVVARLDAVPLALELAAARLRSVDVAELRTRLDEGFRLLAGGPRTASRRQQTIDALIAWSYDLLTDVERTMFARLSVFVGGFDIAAAEGVCADDDIDELDVVELLDSLVDKSLVHVDDASGHLRYRMLETVRAFAAERLDPAMAHRHFDYFLTLAESANLTAEAEQTRRPELVQPETDNLRAALEWAVSSGEVEDGYRLAIALENFWVTLDPFEGIRRFETLFAAGVDVQPILRARALRCYGGSNDMAGRHERAGRAYEESLALFRDVGDERDVAVLLHRIGTCLLNQQRPDDARAYLDESLQISRRVGSARGVAQAIGSMGWAAVADGDMSRAAQLFQESLDLVRDPGWAWWETNMLDGLTDVCRRLGRYDEMAVWAREALVLADQLSDRQSVVFALASLAHAAAETGDAVGAGRLWGAVEAEESRGVLGQWESARAAYEQAVVADADEAFERGREEGRRLTLKQAVVAAVS